MPLLTKRSRIEEYNKEYTWLQEKSDWCTVYWQTLLEYCRPMLSNTVAINVKYAPDYEDFVWKEKCKIFQFFILTICVEMTKLILPVFTFCYGY